ncbi:MAG: respiratory nitrate reductase subunit gamma [Burkholderiaceae bacterium]
MNSLNDFFFSTYPYLCLTVFVLGSLIRFDREAYTWKSDSSQLLRTGSLRLGSNLFHIGILGILGGHLVGLLTPMPVWHWLGIEPPVKQMVAIVAGGLFGALTAAGVILLLARRLGDDRIRATSTRMDILVLWLLLAQVALGMISIGYSLQHLDGGEMVKLMIWAQHLATFQGDAANYVADAAWVFKAHIVLGMTLFLVFPFSRLVHVWSGFGTIAYLARPPQVVRSR